MLPVALTKQLWDSADEQGLGKTIQALALIVSEEPTREDARAALADAQREQNAMALHPESSQARAARAAGIGISPVGTSARACSSAGDSNPGVCRMTSMGSEKSLLLPAHVIVKV